MPRAVRTVLVAGALASLLCAVVLPSTRAAAAPFAYVLNEGSNDVSVLDLADDTLADTIALALPAGTAETSLYPIPGPAIVASSAAPRVYVGDRREGGVISVIDTQTNTVIDYDFLCVTALSIDSVGQRLALSCARFQLWTAGSVNADLSINAPILDLVQNATAVLTPPSQYSFPIASTFSPQGNVTYVAHAGEVTGGWIDAYASNNGAPLFSLPTPGLGFLFDFGFLPWQMRASRDGTRLFFAHQLSNALVTVDLVNETLLPFLPLAARPYDLAVTSGADRVYVSLAGGSIAVVDPLAQSVIDTIPVGGRPTGLLLAANDTRLYVVDSDNGRVRVVRTADGAILSDITVGDLPVAITAVPPPPPPLDTDLDTIADSLDNCPLIANVDQNDGDGDGEGDVCDPCTNIGGGQYFVDQPAPRLRLAGYLGDDPLRFASLRLRARTTIATQQAIDPVVDGARLLVLAPDGETLLDASLPPGLAATGASGWRMRSATRWTFVNRDDDAGIRHMTIDRRGGGDQVTVRAKARGEFLGDDSGAAYAVAVVFGGQDAAASGACGESNFVAQQDCALAVNRRRLNCAP